VPKFARTAKDESEKGQLDMELELRVNKVLNGQDKKYLQFLE